MKQTADFDPLALEILWQRLITVVDEMATVLVRTSFSTVVGAANDFGCEIMDADGRSLAHATRSMPVFNRTLPNVTRAVIEKFGRAGLRPGDVFIGNDPWLNAGHHPDIAVMMPFHRNGELIGIAASIAHVADTGGILDSNIVREAYDEGLLIPLARLYDQGVLNELVLDFVGANVRVPEMVIGDIHAQVTAAHAGSEKILGLMDEYQLATLRPLADAIQGRSEQAMRAAIRRVPDGEYRSEVTFNEFDRDLLIACRITVQDDELAVDFTGTSPQQPQGGINCTFVYTRGHASYGLKCILLPEVPSNSGCYRPLHIEAPAGSVLNARHPASVRMRTRTGWYIHSALFAALADVLPEQVMAPSGLMGGATAYGYSPDTGKPYHSWFFNGGGMGAGAHSDGVSACIYPSSASNIPVELVETAVPILVDKKEFLIDSGGAGRRRGGLALDIAFRARAGLASAPAVSLWLHGQSYPPFGLRGGGDANAAEVYIDDRRLSQTERITETGMLLLDDAETEIRFTTTGGGGFGDPRLREPALVADDVRNELVSVTQAQEIYGVILDPVSFVVNEEATRVARAGQVQ